MIPNFVLFRRVAGVDHVGLGGDFNGIDSLPIGLEDVSKYPDIFAALIEDDEFEWTDEDLAKLANQNLLNTFRSESDIHIYIYIHLDLFHLILIEQLTSCRTLLII